MLEFQERTDSWNQMMLSPKKTAAIHAKRKELSFRDGLENFGTPILMTYLPLLLLALLLSGNFEAIYLAALLFSIAATALAIIAVSGLFTLMLSATTSFFGGKAEIGRLYYMVSLAAAPTFVFTIVINIAVLLLKSIMQNLSFPLGAGVFQLAGDLVAFSMLIYGFYLLTVSIGALFKFGWKKALVSWLVPAIILLAAGAFLSLTVLLGVLRFLFKTL
ncbi:MAG: hypothetical protein WC588_00780 [Candidatus Micrarchaeia archaeon]